MEEKKITQSTARTEAAPPTPPPTDDERIALVARELLDKHIAAFSELAK